jgi:glycosyltransferase involved in cell wall biosynthesis
MNILLLNYYWPPSGGPAVQRWLDITNKLATLGAQVTVITIDPEKATFPFIDETLCARVHPSVEIRTTDTSELFSVYKKYIGKGKVPGHGMAAQSDEGLKQKAARFVRGNLLLPDPRRGWNKHAFAAAVEVLQQKAIDIIFTAGPPHSTHLIGKKLKSKFPAIPWVVDFHDYWTEISYLDRLFYRTKLASFIDRKIEKGVLKKADYVMTHCESSVNIQQQKSGKLREKFILYRMGFNELLFNNNNAPKVQDKFTITYTGMIAGFYSPNAFFSAVKRCINEHPKIPLEIRFVGSIDQDVRTIIQTTGLQNHVVELGYVSHEKAIQFMYASTALLLVNPLFKYNKFHVPGKLYEYLAVRKPIISIAEKGSENEVIISNAAAGKNFAHSDEEGMIKYISSLMTDWDKAKNLDLPLNPNIAQYGRNFQTEMLAKKITEIKSL